MGNEGWTETVADGESVAMVAGSGGGEERAREREREGSVGGEK